MALTYRSVAVALPTTVARIQEACDEAKQGATADGLTPVEEAVLPDDSNNPKQIRCGWWCS
jgi:hypothetical protein